MKFERNDEIGEALQETLGHELFVATDSYYAFLIYTKQLKNSRSRFMEVACYQAYANLLRSLYEYYSGILKLNSGNTTTPDSNILDNFFNDAAQRLINFYRPIESGANPQYPEKVPTLFGKDFRIVRNRASHADFRRMKPDSDDSKVTLLDFYRSYHFYVHKMLSHPQLLWGGKYYVSYNWHQIENFADVVMQEVD